MKYIKLFEQIDDWNDPFGEENYYVPLNRETILDELDGISRSDVSIDEIFDVPYNSLANSFIIKFKNKDLYDDFNKKIKNKFLNPRIQHYEHVGVEYQTIIFKNK